VAGLAACVPRIRIGPLVAGNTYRHPAVVANMAATIDHMSGGRLVLGLGAGWQENEHRAYGLEYYTVGERLRRLEEACQVIKALFNEPRANFQGRFYRLEDAPMEPKPVQKPLPLMIGGGGEKVTLRITARYADEWNVWGDVDRLRQKMGVLDGHCENVGRDPRAIQRSAAVLVYLSDDPAVVKRIREEPQARPSIAGNSAELADIVAEYARAGVDELIVPDFHMEPGTAKTEFLDRFIEEVAPAAR
jgi:alkanesulfonate monooxygenase SsuD/methylene tetrahydromethanopterin reductase-like flavin-dependent oxidoreductase (luciferase family)